MTRIGWWHCPSGAAGDMILGALIDAGAPLATLQSAIDALGVGPIRLTAARVDRAGSAATQVSVAVPEQSPPRNWPQIRQLLLAAELPDRVRQIGLGTFERLAVAEATVHGGTVDDVHFHEVGALDALADIVGAAAGLAALEIDHCLAAGPAAGAPAPATVELARAAGMPLQIGGTDQELLTPTGASILTATVRDWDSVPTLRLLAQGYGAGSLDRAEQPNVIQLLVGDVVEVSPSADTQLVIEANVDDLDPRLWPEVLRGLLAAGAADAWLTPIVMKKGRPAHTVHALTGVDAADEVRRILFRETSTIGIREHPVRKRALPRDVLTVHVDGQPVRVKLATLHGEVVSATPEFEDVAAAAAVLGRPVRAVLAAAASAAQAAGVSPG